MSDPQRDSDTVLHQEAHEDIVDEMLDGQIAENVVIANLAAITGGEAPTEAEHNLVVTKVNAILDALRNSRVIPTA